MGSDYVRLEDIVDRVCVGFVGSCNKDYTNSTGIPMIRTTNLTDNGIKYEDLKYVTETFHQKNKKSQLCYGDILVARHGDNGLPSIYESNEEANCLNVVIVKPKINKDYVDNYYLLYALRSSFVVNQVKSLVGGSVQGVINTKAIAALNIPYPQRIVREEIVQQLKMLNKKIALNRQINQTLEQMAQTLFKSWFVDFDPVIDNALDATANGQNIEIPESLAKRFEARKAVRESEGFEPLPADIRQLFPCEFEESELGFVPKGWGVKSCEDIATRIGMGPFGSNIKTSTFVDSGVPIINGKQLKNTLLEESFVNFVTEEHSIKLSSSLVQSGDLVLTHRGTIGQVSLVPECGLYSKYVVSQSQFYLKPNHAEIGKYYLIYFFKSNIGQHRLLSNSSQVGVPSIARPSSHLKQLRILVPEKVLRNEFESHIYTYMNLIQKNHSSINILTKLRDTLLPKLISGELRLDSPQGEALQQVVSAE